MFSVDIALKWIPWWNVNTIVWHFQCELIIIIADGATEKIATDACLPLKDDEEFLGFKVYSTSLKMLMQSYI